MRDRLVTIVLSVAATYGLMRAAPEPMKELVVDRLIVRKELIVSDTGVPWEKGYEAHQIPRGVYAKSLGDGPGGLWVRSRLIKGEIDDPSTTGSMPSSATAACAGRQDISRGTNGWTAPGGRWRSSRVRGSS